MRKISIIVFAAFVIGSIVYFILDQTKNKTAEYKQQPKDTIWTSILYCNDANLNDYQVTTAKLFIKDSVLIDAFSKVKWFRDSSYRVPVFEDQRDAKGNIKKDSAGNVLKQIRWQNLPKTYLLEDFHKNWPLPKF